jgi:tetratricopeptide (TPR) repeat protein
MKPAGMDVKLPPESVVRSVSEAYERGQHLEALHRAESFSPLAQWAGVHAAGIASRLANSLGAPKLARRLALRAWRTDPAHPLAQFEYGIQFLQHRGPLLFWYRSTRWPAAVGGTTEWQADLLALRGFVASDLRDFDVAEKFLAQAEALAPTAPWVRLQRAHLLERLDQVEQALELAQNLLKLHPHPFYRPGVQTLAHLMQLLDRDESAIELLQAAADSLQNGPILAQLYGILTENQRWSEAAAVLERYIQSSPLLEKPLQLWVSSQKARVAYYNGRRMQSAGFAREAKDAFNLAFAQKLEQPTPEIERVRLEVPFVRQHFKTCAPATQAALGRFWRMPADHLQLVEAVCYDGTPHWKQREWSERNGWIVRQFRVTWESAVELLTRGIPFAISTVDATSAHMQAVMGFDRTRQALYLRDPFQPYSLECIAENFFKRYKAFGPQGTVFLPQAEAGRLNGVQLPDEDLCNRQYHFDLALSKHDRPAARSAVGWLEENHPDHPLTWQLRQQLAAYDANSAEEIRCLDHLLELFPNTAARTLNRLAAMRTASREEKITFLQQACEFPAADPALCFEMARLLSADAQQNEATRRWLKRGLRGRPVDSIGATILANLNWHEGRYAEATELYRLAATLEDFREPAYCAWFIACRQIRQTDHAMEHLRDRLKRFGKRSAQPAFTLAWALQELEQPHAALEILTGAVKLRPDDGHVLLRAAVLQARLGKSEEAVALLESAKGKVRENERLRAGAEIAEILNEPASALRYSKQILELEPLAVDAHNCVARGLAMLEGRSAALAHLSQTCAAHPSHCALRRIYIEWVRGADAAAVLTTADEILKVSPGDAWTRRERAWALTQQNRLEDGLMDAQAAARIEPRNPSSPGLVARILVLLHRQEEARVEYRRAVELDVDNNSAIQGLLSLAPGDNERKEELTFIERELVRQVVSGDGLLAFGAVARPLQDPETLLKTFRQAHAEHPHLWHAWIALIDQLQHLGRMDEALSLARKATERFPHLPRVWHELAGIHKRRHEPDAEILAAQRAFDINPGWNRAAFVLAAAFERQHKLEEARKIYERALLHQPRDPMLLAQVGSILWQLRLPNEALLRMEQALRTAPDYYWAWQHLRDWSGQSGQSERLVNFARELTKQRPGEARVWLMLARTLHGPSNLAERMAAVDRALSLEPNSNDYWDAKIELLAQDGSYDLAIETGRQALAACSSNQFMLHGRLAWIEAQRGKLPEAISKMRAVLADNAGYIWGWQNLSVWLLQQEAYAEAENAIEQLLKLNPADAWAQRQLAQIRLKRNDRAGAQDVFGKVLRTSPTDQNAAENLFDLQLESAHLDKAAETLRNLQIHHPGARTMAREIMLLSRKNDGPAALELFKTLISQPNPDPWPIHAAIQAFKRAWQDGEALRVMKKALRTEACNPQVGHLLMELLVHDKHGLRAIWEFTRIRSIKVRRSAAPSLVKGLAQAKKRLLFRLLLWRQREFLHQDDQTWGQVGYALTTFKRMRAASDWMKDWQSRSYAEPWMLFNLVYALRTVGRYADSSQVVEHAVKLWGHRHQNSADLRMFLALEQALAGETKSARENLQQAHFRLNVIYDKQLQAIIQSLLEFQQAEPKNQPHLFESIRQRLNGQISHGQLLTGDRDVRRTFRRAARLMIQSGAGWKAKLWFAWKLNWQWSLLPAVPLAIGTIVALSALGQPQVLVAPFFLFLLARGLGQSFRKKK